MVQFRSAEREIQFKLVYYGPALGGKTTNLEALHELTDPDGQSQLTSLKTAEDRTLFFDFLPLELSEIRGYKVRLQIYTVPGQVQYNTTRKVVLAGADGLVFVADSSPSRLQENYISWENMKANLLANRMAFDATPVVLQCNKRDLPGAAPVPEILSAMHCEERPVELGCAVTGEGVVESFERVVQEVVLGFGQKFGLHQKGVSAEDLRQGVARAFAPFRGKLRAGARRPPEAVFETVAALEQPLSEEEQLAAALHSSTQLAEQYQETRRLTDMYRERLAEMTALYELGRDLQSAGDPEEALPRISAAVAAARSGWSAEAIPGAETPLVPVDALSRPLGHPATPTAHLVVVPPEGRAAGPEDVRFLDLLQEMVSPRLQAIALMAELALSNERLEHRVVERTAELADALDRLRELDRLKRAFLNGVSHEMRTPLTNVRSYAELLLRYPDQNPQDRKEYLQVIGDESLRLEGLISDLLSFQKVKEPFRGTPCDLGEALEAALDVARQAAEARYVQFQVQRPKGPLPFPLNREDATVLFRQLLENAVKFSPDGVRVRVLLLVDPERMVFSVRDFGPGFPKDKREKVTAPLVEGGADAFSKKSGLGLGLFLVREVLAKYSGTLSVEDMEPGANVVVEIRRGDSPTAP